MEPLRTNVTISNRFDLSGSAVRGLWFRHDFYSDYCPSFHPPREMNFIHLNTAVEMEMSVKKMMTNKHLKEMKKVRDAYDEMMEEKLKEEEKMKKSKGPKPKSAEKVSKAKFVEEIEPPIVDEMTYVDIDKEYLVYEADQVEKDRESFLPENLGLFEHEVSD